MIGVLSKPNELWAVREFFQLIKTPWEFYLPHGHYDLVIVTSDAIPAGVNAKVLAIYNSKRLEFDGANGFVAQAHRSNVEIEWNDVEFPVYGDQLVFQPMGREVLRVKGSLEHAAFEVRRPNRRIIRLGYDLFQEVSFLLSRGQPRANASIPTLELHISLLRYFLWNARISFLEIRAVPAGHDFIVCLTHDVDFIGIRQHKFDHTMWGFVYRGLIGSVISALRMKAGWDKVLQNWKAVLSLPLVHLGLLPDFWLEFERYSEMEKGLGSTFFFIPYKNHAGQDSAGRVSQKRAAKYDVRAFQEEVRGLVQNGFEVGLHGLDAWQNPRKAQDELSRICDVAGQSEAGARMHWLYFDERSPKVLEEGGVAYDSTFGYNDAIGFRAGTAQVFCSSGAEELLELSLNIQDTALFYPNRMNVSETEAMEACKQVIRTAAQFGGVLTLNWHTRSLSPERLWGDFYSQLIKELQSYRAWFASGREVVEWFRKRRLLIFESVVFDDGCARVRLSGDASGRLPFAVRVYQPDLLSSENSRTPQPSYQDIDWHGEPELEIPLKQLV